MGPICQCPFLIEMLNVQKAWPTQGATLRIRGIRLWMRFCLDLQNPTWFRSVQIEVQTRCAGRIDEYRFVTLEYNELRDFAKLAN